MPLPRVSFNNAISVDARVQALQKLGQWVDSNEVSAVKQQVLRAILQYANKHLLDPSPLHLVDPSHFLVCQHIFNRANLPDIFFLQLVRNQMNDICDVTSELKKAVLPMVNNYRRALLLPLVRQQEKATKGLGLAVILMRNPGSLLINLASFILNSVTAEAKIERILNDRLIFPAESRNSTEYDDVFEDAINVLAEYVDRSCSAAIGFFNKVLQGNPLPQAAYVGPRVSFEPQK